MSRRETMLEARWRVYVLGAGATRSHDSQFKEEGLARAYYEALHVPGSRKMMEVRRAGAQRFEVLAQEEMT